MKGPVLIDMTQGPANQVGTLRSKNNAALIYKGSVVAGTTGSGTKLLNGKLTCDSVYCHSNGYAAIPAFATAPDWYTGVFTGDRCANCHGNAPNSTKVGDSSPIAGSPSHYNTNWLNNIGATGGHAVGIHAQRITDGINFTGVLSPGTTDPASHGRTSLPNPPTTISCNTCHWSVVTTSANAASAQCANCHSRPESNQNAFIADKSLHVNGSVSVKFRPTTVYSKAQLKEPSFGLLSTAGYFKRFNGYKNPTSYDASVTSLDVGSYAGNGGNCTNICHFNNPVRWDNIPAATCSSCHTAL
jgi:predicted CxxxxCH...CXXCH cytochrome family protein